MRKCRCGSLSAWLPAHTRHGQQALRLLTRPLSPLRLPRQPRSQISGGRLRPRGWSQVSKHTDVRDAAPRGQVGPGAKPPPARLPSPKSRRPERTRASRARSEEPRARGPGMGQDSDGLGSLPTSPPCLPAQHYNSRENCRGVELSEEPVSTALFLEITRATRRVQRKPQA